jgi:hypothetical protein
MGGVFLWDETMEFGTYVDRKFEGIVEMHMRSNIKHKGNCYNGEFHGHVVTTYPDGYAIEGEWINGQPTFDISHPMVKECMKQGNAV